MGGGAQEKEQEENIRVKGCVGKWAAGPRKKNRRKILEKRAELASGKCAAGPRVKNNREILE